MAGVAQLVRASDCDSEGRGFESRYSPHFSLVYKSDVCVIPNSRLGIHLLLEAF